MSVLKIIFFVGNSLTKIAVSDFLNIYPTLLLYGFSPDNELVKSQSKGIRIMLDKVVEAMNPRRHVCGVLAAARRILFLNRADYLRARASRYNWMADDKGLHVFFTESSSLFDLGFARDDNA